MSSQRRLRTFGVATLGVVALLASMGLANASPSTRQVSETQKTQPANAVSRATVTLISGDVVTVQRFADGRQVATAAARAGRTDIAFSTQYDEDSVYVIPSDAIPLLAQGKLDRGLFDVAQLVKDGYDDAHASSTPVIVQYKKASPKATLRGTSKRFTLESMNATAVRANKQDTQALWTSIASTPDLQKVWLDGRVQVTDDVSNEQIGAPAAWQAGFDGTGVKVAVLDTGIDQTHPDFAGKVAAEHNFTTDPSATDLFGHGTHVASTVAGSGAASAGKYKGVAHGATLLNGKVLDRNGSGTDSQIIEGMEWAAAQGAKVANLSLGTHSPSDGTDPLVQAVDRISKETGTLFVIAADNIGPGDSTITSPGWANEALTVGAVNSEDALANFSSRGPRLGDYGIKPDITAPGVQIIAARAEGTQLGPIVDEKYVKLDGTSMAAPHTAAAAAILAQEFPNWTNTQLKDALISTAKTIQGNSVYQQGGGRLDVARAFSQKVYSSPGTLNLGFLPWPHTTSEPIVKPVTFSNVKAEPVTLDLTLALSGKNGPAPAGMFSVSPATVTIPAGGSAGVTVTADPSKGDPDLYGGYLVGTADGVEVHTSVGLYKEPEMYNVTVPATARDGRQADGISQVELWGPNLPGGFQTKYYRGGVTPVFRVPPGTYSLMGYLFTMDEPNLYATESTMVGKPELTVTADATVPLSAVGANEITTKTAKPSEPLILQLAYYRKVGEPSFSSSFTLSPPIDRAFAVPTSPVQQGEFEFYDRWTLQAPTLQAKVTAPQSIALDPFFLTNSPKVDGKHTLPLVYAGSGRPEDFVGKPVRGRIALVQRTTGMTFNSQVVNAANAGAAAAIIYNNRPGLLLGFGGNPGTVPIPSFTIDQAPGQMLVSLLQQGNVKVQYSGTSISPYLYEVIHPNPDAISANQSHEVTNKNSIRLNSDYYAHLQSQVGADVLHAFRPWTAFAFGFARELPRPLKRTEWVSTGDTSWFHIAWANYPFDGEYDGLVTSYEPGPARAERTFAQVSRPGFPKGLTGWEEDGAPPTRVGDELAIAMFPYADATHTGLGTAGDVASTKLYRGSKLLAEGAYPVGTFDADVAEEATYRLVTSLQRKQAWSKYSTDIDTTWTFKSARPAENARVPLPLLQVDYDLRLDLWNKARDRSDYTFRLQAGRNVKTAKVWVSFNDGATWKRVDARQNGGSLVVTVTHPAVSRTSGAVSLRVQAADAAGNAIDQTVIRAYGLKAK
ncbi:S8 family serine peptidase [Tenggerimyces flavus]|uniref:S8 family serine peptidase n=1 Tax=Tenggerimyces flavus TaxID=1708749 RepID=A0ABV7YET6_9ACTN|nr:S8 family serine peptidase [Tenggerimyces flavus]MBM7786822.1 subtilisin family serine protease [Tenggerimyces flavus]